jgi:hypothetical protein
MSKPFLPITITAPKPAFNFVAGSGG